MNLLGNHSVPCTSFSKQKEIFKEFHTEEFKNLSDKQKSDRINQALLHCIEQQQEKHFLLIPILQFITEVNHKKFLDGYNLSHFELWLNQFSGLSAEENYKVRGKIMGKYVPRDDFQVFFPVGMGKYYAGSHYVTAHSSPDLDTTVASFWGWVDAFSARVSDGLHLWNVPGGPPLSQAEIDLLFYKVFGEEVFLHLAKTRTSLGLSSIDLMNQKGVIKKEIKDSTVTIDHERMQNAIIIVDEKGYFLGDWRNFDVEGVRQIVILLNQCLHWFENHLLLRLISLFSQESFSKEAFPLFLDKIFGISFKNCHPVNEYTEKQRGQLDIYLSQVLDVKEGINATFVSFATTMGKKGVVEFQDVISLLHTLKDTSLFLETGHLTDNRPTIFHSLEKIILALDKAILSIRRYEERLEVALNIKTKVFGYYPQVVSYRDEVEEIRSKIDAYPYLTVTTSDKEGRMIPMGIIHASDLHKNILGTVSLRDFCNRDETKIPSYLEVISVIDHHKSSLSTLSPPLAFITDSQSSNALIAELCFTINDQYSTGGMKKEKIEEQMDRISRNLSTASQKRIFQRLLQKHTICEKSWPFFVSPEREYIEYLHFLYAILDDTDLLTKVSRRDVECVASLLNRLKSLAIGEEVEVVALDDLPRDEKYNAAAAQRILQNPEMYSLYQKIYHSKEESIEKNLERCAEGQSSSIFVDTKEQNGCSRVGQTKMFSRNFSLFKKLSDQVRKQWVQEAALVSLEKPEIDLHLHMISTIAGAEDVFRGTAGEYTHQDELWIFIPETESGIEHLKSFLNAFKTCPAILQNHFTVEFLGKNGPLLEQIFKESFLPLEMKASPKNNLPIAVLRYKAGILNSRKALISPYLPHLVY